MTKKKVTHHKDNLLEEYAKWLFNTGRALKTIASYKTDIKMYHAFLDEKVAGSEQLLSRFLFVKYKEHLLNQDMAVSTINKKINSLKVYNDFLQIKGYVSDSFIWLKRDRVKVAAGTQAQVDVFSDEEIEKLLFYIEDSSKVSVRNRLIVYILLYTGVRVSELISIKRKDIDPISQILTVHGKGGKVREISLRHDVVEVMSEYMKTERANSRFHDSEYLLVSKRSEKMHQDGVRDMLKQLAQALGFRIYPHRFRRTLATNLMRTGVPIITVSAITGHSSIQVLEKHYISVDNQSKLDALSKL